MQEVAPPLPVADHEAVLRNANAPALAVLTERPREVAALRREADSHIAHRTVEVHTKRVHSR